MSSSGLSANGHLSLMDFMFNEFASRDNDDSIAKGVLVHLQHANGVQFRMICPDGLDNAQKAMYSKQIETLQTIIQDELRDEGGEVTGSWLGGQRTCADQEQSFVVHLGRETEDWISGFEIKVGTVIGLWVQLTRVDRVVGGCTEKPRVFISCTLHRYGPFDRNIVSDFANEVLHALLPSDISSSGQSTRHGIQLPKLHNLPSNVQDIGTQGGGFGPTCNPCSGRGKSRHPRSSVLRTVTGHSKDTPHVCGSSQTNEIRYLATYFCRASAVRGQSGNCRRRRNKVTPLLGKDSRLPVASGLEIQISECMTPIMRSISGKDRLGTEKMDIMPACYAVEVHEVRHSIARDNAKGAEKGVQIVQHELGMQYPEDPRYAGKPQPSTGAGGMQNSDKDIVWQAGQNWPGFERKEEQGGQVHGLKQSLPLQSIRAAFHH
ncbi:hypothetical protein C8R47DRAFT_1075533 [Mycena vitilis]|nr:hypothetical protein C8R47DRAFT_1075533 [Mycena vitilis]